MRALWGLKKRLSKFDHTSGPETYSTLITGGVWQMGLPCIVKGTSGSAPPGPQRPPHHNISGFVYKTSLAFFGSLRELSQSEFTTLK